MRNRVLFLTALFLAYNAAATAHDLYLSFEADRQVCAGIGEAFPASEVAITADRLNAFQLRSSAKPAAPLTGKVKGKRFCATAPGLGPFLAEMTVQPRFINLAGKDFSSYIHGEGLSEVEKARAERGEKDRDGRELYSRYSKLLAGSDAALATAVLGHALEIVPERDPGELKRGESLPVRVLFKGKPLANAQISAVYAGAQLKGHEYPVTTRTDADGRALLKLDRAGLWYARMIHMEAAQNDPEVDWRSYFATLTFAVGR
jgi:hypothetical protein